MIQDKKQRFVMDAEESDIRPEDIHINPRNSEQRNLWREALAELGEPARITLAYLMREFGEGGYLWVPKRQSALSGARRRSIGMDGGSPTSSTSLENRGGGVGSSE